MNTVEKMAVGTGLVVVMGGGFLAATSGLVGHAAHNMCAQHPELEHADLPPLFRCGESFMGRMIDLVKAGGIVPRTMEDQWRDELFAVTALAGFTWALRRRSDQPEPAPVTINYSEPDTIGTG